MRAPLAGYALLVLLSLPCIQAMDPKQRRSEETKMDEAEAKVLLDLMTGNKPGGEKDTALSDFYNSFTGALMDKNGSFSNDDGKSFLAEVADGGVLQLTLSQKEKGAIIFTPIKGSEGRGRYPARCRRGFGFEDSENNMYFLSYETSSNDDVTSSYVIYFDEDKDSKLVTLNTWRPTMNLNEAKVLMNLMAGDGASPPKTVEEPFYEFCIYVLTLGNGRFLNADGQSFLAEVADGGVLQLTLIEKGKDAITFIPMDSTVTVRHYWIDNDKHTYGFTYKKGNNDDVTSSYVIYFDEDKDSKLVTLNTWRPTMNLNEAKVLMNLMAGDGPSSPKTVEEPFYELCIYALTVENGRFINADGQSVLAEVADGCNLQLTLREKGEEPITFIPMDSTVTVRQEWIDNDQFTYSFTYKKDVTASYAIYLSGRPNMQSVALKKWELCK
eukprot:GHVS01035121.1.p1 GENE.GHVS01035121.1~~GHVS01035121.1.p1  ORF type:complete len:492 (-),score=44.43 GHVS01035121.1:872-2191(-)